MGGERRKGSGRGGRAARLGLLGLLLAGAGVGERGEEQQQEQRQPEQPREPPPRQGAARAGAARCGGGHLPLGGPAGVARVRRAGCRCLTWAWHSAAGVIGPFPS